MTERLTETYPCDLCNVEFCYRQCYKMTLWAEKAKEKLAEYENDEDDGRLVVLPCKVGTRVYEIYQFCGCGAWEIEEHKIKLEDLDKIGKTVFLTEEEAEKALKDKMDFHI